MNRKKIICFKNINNEKLDFRKFLIQYVSQFFDMRNLNIMWLYAVRFVTCKVSVDAFRLYSNLFLAKLSLFEFGVTFAEWHWQFICMFSCLIRG